MRLALTCVAMGVAYFLSTMAIGETNVPMTAEEASQAGMALVFVSAVNALVLSFLILGSPWHGPKLVGLVILIQLGVETLMTQIDTLYFNGALRMGRAEFAAIVAAGVLRALIFAPLAILILGNMGKSEQPSAPLLSFIVAALGLTVLISWTFNHTGGSLIPLFLYHCAFDFIGNAAGIFAVPALFWLFAGVVGVAAVLVILRDWPCLSRRVTGSTVITLIRPNDA